MRKWNCNTGLLVGEPWKGEGGDVFALALSPDGKTIACGRMSVQCWNTNGEMIEDIWTSHKREVQALAWSPSGSHLTSAFLDGTILIRKAESGEVEERLIETKQGGVCSLAYSLLGDRTVSSGSDWTAWIWDSKTGELLVGPIEDLGAGGASVVWYSDSSKLFFTSDDFARVFESASGKLLYRLQHHAYLNSIALSSKNNVLACVGDSGIAQLWDIESQQPLGQSFDQEDGGNLLCVSFPRDGRYVAYGGRNMKITLWMVQDITPELAQSIQQKTRSQSPSSSCLDVSSLTFDCLHCLIHGTMTG